MTDEGGRLTFDFCHKDKFLGKKVQLEYSYFRNGNLDI